MIRISAAVEAELARLRAENARLLRLLKLTPQQAAPPGPAQAAYFEAPPGLVDDGSQGRACSLHPDGLILRSGSGRSDHRMEMSSC